MSNIFVRIIGEFQKKGFDQAQTATSQLDKNFKKLGRSAKQAFAAVAGYQALTASVKAFAAQDAAVTKLNKSLENLGLKYQGINSGQFLDGLEKTYAISKEKLYPAFQELANATLNVSKAQDLLGKSLDIASGTGSSLDQTVNALAKAYKGNFTALGKLQNAYTATELKAMGLTDAVQTLSDLYAGSAKADADSYQGRLEQLTLAVDDAKVAIGQGLIDSLEALGNGNYQQGLKLISDGAGFIADQFKKAAYVVAYFRKFAKQGLLATKGQLAEFRRDFEGAFTVDPAKQRTFMREQSKNAKTQDALNKKIAANRDAAEKRANDQAAKRAKLQKAEALKNQKVQDASNIFDLNRIQIEAALKGKLNDSEIARLNLQKAIMDENISNIEFYTKQLTLAEAELAKLQNLANVQPYIPVFQTPQTPAAPATPAPGGGSAAAEVISGVPSGTQEIAVIPIPDAGVDVIPFPSTPVFNPPAGSDTTELIQNAVEDLAATSDSTQTLIEAASQNIDRIASEPAFQADTISAAITGLAATRAEDLATQFADSATLFENAATDLLAASPSENLATQLADSATLFESAASDVLAQTAPIIDSNIPTISDAGLSAMDAINSFNAAQAAPITVQVTVQGSVTTERDLVETITEVIQGNQRNGVQLLAGTRPARIAI